MGTQFSCNVIATNRSGFYLPHLRTLGGGDKAGGVFRKAATVASAMSYPVVDAARQHRRRLGGGAKAGGRLPRLAPSRTTLAASVSSRHPQRARRRGAPLRRGLNRRRLGVAKAMCAPGVGGPPRQPGLPRPGGATRWGDVGAPRRTSARRACGMAVPARAVDEGKGSAAVVMAVTAGCWTAAPHFHSTIFPDVTNNVCICRKVNINWASRSRKTTMATEQKKAFIKRKHLIRDSVIRAGIKELCFKLKIRDYCRPFKATVGFIPLGSIPVPTGNRAPFPEREFSLLSLRTQRLIRRLILLLLDLFDTNLCLSLITEDTFVVDSESEYPMLTTKAFLDDIVDLDPTTRKQQIQKNMDGLADLIVQTIMAGDAMPEEMAEGLMPLMRKNADEMLYLISNHPCLVPLDNRADLNLRIHTELVEVLMKMNNKQYKKVLKDIIFPDDWRRLIKANEYLTDFYSKSTYHQNEKKKDKIALQVMRFIRNSSPTTHGMSNAVDTKKKKLNYTRINVAEMLYSIAPLALHSAMKALHSHCRKELKALKIESLFG